MSSSQAGDDLFQAFKQWKTLERIKYNHDHQIVNYERNGVSLRQGKLGFKQSFPFQTSVPHSNLLLLFIVTSPAKFVP
jgi:hypothetical protein